MCTHMHLIRSYTSRQHCAQLCSRTCLSLNLHTHTHTHTHTHARTHTFTQINTHTRYYACTHTRTPSQVLYFMPALRTALLTYTCARAFTFSHIHTLTRIHTHTFLRFYTSRLHCALLCSRTCQSLIQSSAWPVS